MIDTENVCCDGHAGGGGGHRASGEAHREH
jgi:hypothetical protein